MPISAFVNLLCAWPLTLAGEARREIGRAEAGAGVKSLEYYAARVYRIY